MKTEAETEAIINDVLREFDKSCSTQTNYDFHDHQRKRQALRKYGRKFANCMNGNKPFKSDDEACKALAPIVIWGLWKAASMFAQWVIRRLWAHWHKQ